MQHIKAQLVQHIKAATQRIEAPAQHIKARCNVLNQQRRMLMQNEEY